MPACPEIERRHQGEFLFGPDRRPRRLHLIAAGLVRLVDPPDGGRRVVRTVAWLGAGEIVGWSALAPGAASRIWARAERETRLIPLPTRLLARRIARHPRLALEMMAQLARHLQAAHAEAGELIRLETPQRLARARRRLADHPALAQSEDRLAIIQLTHADLASRTGISRETVSLILSRWRRVGVVKTGRGRLAVQLARLDDLLGKSEQGGGGHDPRAVPRLIEMTRQSSGPVRARCANRRGARPRLHGGPRPIE